MIIIESNNNGLCTSGLWQVHPRLPVSLQGENTPCVPRITPSTWLRAASDWGADRRHGRTSGILGPSWQQEGKLGSIRSVMSLVLGLSEFVVGGRREKVPNGLGRRRSGSARATKRRRDECRRPGGCFDTVVDHIGIDEKYKGRKSWLSHAPLTDHGLPNIARSHESRHFNKPGWRQPNTGREFRFSVCNHLIYTFLQHVRYISISFPSLK